MPNDDEIHLKFEPAHIEWSYLAGEEASILAEFERLAASNQALMDSISQSHRAFTEIQRSMTESERALAEGFRSVWERYSHYVADAMQNLRQAFQKFEAIGRYGWTIPMEASLPDIYLLADSIKDEATADAAFVHYFMESDPENLETLIRNVVGSPVFDLWRPATEEAVACLRERRYRACVALLLPLVDGVCATLFKVPRFEKSQERKRFFEQKIRSLPNDSVVKAMWLSFV